MLNQQPDFLYLIELAHLHGKPVCVGGPDVSSSPHLYAAADFQVIGEAEHIMTDFIAAWERGERKGVFTAEKFKIDMTQSAAAALRSAQARTVSLHRHPVLARLPVHLRVLRHHRAVRPRAAHQDQRPDPRRAAGALRPRLSRPRRFRRRQLHRQPQERAPADAAAEGVAGGARLSVRVLDRSLDQPRRRRRDAAVDEGCELLRHLRRHREPGSRDADADAQEAEHQAQHRREHPQDLRLRHVRDRGLHPRLRHREGLDRRSR